MTNDQTLPMDCGPGPGTGAGSRLGPYELLNLLGEGAFGHVWQARDAGGRMVALKLLRPEVMGDADTSRRFEREARLGMQLDHPNVVRVFDAGRVDGRLFLATEFLTGGSVAGLIESYQGNQGLPVADAVRIFADAMRGLQALAQHGLIHRDVKPANLLLDAAGVAKVSDFGLARSTSIDRTRFTADGAIVGSPAYIAPEQISGECEPDIRCDLYAGGIVLFELLTGRTPFGSGTVLEILSRHLDVAPPRVRAQRAEVPQQLDALLDELLRKSPAKRPATPAEVLARLERMGFCQRAPATVFPATVFPVTLPADVAATAFPGTIQDAQVKPLAFPATVFPATIPGGSLFPTTIPHGNNFPATLPDSRPTAPSAGATPRGTLSGAMTIGAPLSQPVELTPTAAPALGRAKLAITGPTGTRWLFVYAGVRLIAGRDGIEHPGQDVCLRCFPARTMAESSKRISAQHIKVEVDAGNVSMTDLGSTSGTILNGERIPAKVAQRICDQAEIRIADVLDLRAQIGAPPTHALRVRGIGDVLTQPSVFLDRTGNGAEHAYLLVPGCVSLGRDGMPASGGDVQVELLAAGGWLWWRVAGAQAVEPLFDGAVLRIGNSSAHLSVTRISVTAIDSADHKG